MDPHELRYTKTHEWAHPEGGLITVGISKFAADQLTDVTYVELPHVGHASPPRMSCGSRKTTSQSRQHAACVSGRYSVGSSRLATGLALRDHSALHLAPPSELDNAAGDDPLQARCR